MIQFVPQELWGGFTGLSRGLNSIGEGLAMRQTPYASQRRQEMSNPYFWVDKDTQEFGGGTPWWIRKLYGDRLNVYTDPETGQRLSYIEGVGEVPESFQEYQERLARTALEQIITGAQSRGNARRGAPSSVSNEPPGRQNYHFPIGPMTEGESFYRDTLSKYHTPNSFENYSPMFLKALYSNYNSPLVPFLESGGPVEKKSNPALDMLLSLIGIDKSKGEVPIRAHKGEYVLNKEATKAIGKENLDVINNMVPKMDMGGFISQYGEQVPTQVDVQPRPPVVEGAADYYIYYINELLSAASHGDVDAWNELVKLSEGNYYAREAMQKIRAGMYGTTGASDPELPSPLTGGRSGRNLQGSEPTMRGNGPSINLSPPSVGVGRAVVQSTPANTRGSLRDISVAEILNDLLENSSERHYSSRGDQRRARNTGTPDEELNEELIVGFLDRNGNFIPGDTTPPAGKSALNNPTHPQWGPKGGEPTGETERRAPSPPPISKEGGSGDGSPTPQSTPPQQNTPVQAPTPEYRHYGDAPDVNWEAVANMTPEQVMQYLTTVAGNTWTPPQVQYGADGGVQYTKNPQTELAIQMMNQYLGGSVGARATQAGTEKTQADTERSKAETSGKQIENELNRRHGEEAMLADIKYKKAAAEYNEAMSQYQRANAAFRASGGAAVLDPKDVASIRNYHSNGLKNQLTALEDRIEQERNKTAKESLEKQYADLWLRWKIVSGVVPVTGLTTETLKQYLTTDKKRVDGKRQEVYPLDDTELQSIVKWAEDNWGPGALAGMPVPEESSEDGFNRADEYVGD